MRNLSATQNAIIELNHHELQRLIFLLRRPEQTGVFWINCDSNYIKQPLQDAIAAAVPAAPSVRVHLNDKTTSIVKAIASGERISSGTIVHVMGIEHAAKTGDFPFLLNLERSALFTHLGCYVVIWGDHNSAASLSKKAYDFWSWLFNVFEFTTPPELLTERQKGFNRSIELSQQTIPIPNKDSAERISHLEFQYRQFADYFGTNPTKIQAIDLTAIAVALARAYKDEWKYQKMIDLLQPLWDRFEATLELVNKVSVLSNLGAAYQGAGSYETAKGFRELALANSLLQYGTNHPSVAEAQSNLALVYRDLGDLQRAKELLEHALATDIAHYGTNHPDVAALQSNLGAVNKDLGDLRQAKELLERALATDIANYGDNHPSVAIGQSNLATVYQDLGDLQQAKELLEKALATDIANYGDNHPTVAITQSNLALVYLDLGDLQRAKELLEQALASGVANYGDNHPVVATRQSNLATVYQDLGDLQQAKELLEQALASDIANYGANHPSVATTQHNLAWVSYDMGAFAEAKQFAEQAYATRLKILGPEHPLTITTRQLLEELQQAGY